MPKEESTGLFSKVVKFVRSPGAGWSDADQEAADSQLSKQMLKEMIERKRRNDFVRKREFDMLRKLRRSEVMAGQDPAARPSFFQSSLPSKPDDRASTLKKIDEIEAQMSMQWWKTKHGDREKAGSSTNFPMSGAMPADSPPRSAEAAAPSGPMPVTRSAAYSKTAPQELAKPAPPKEPEPILDAELDFTKELFDAPTPAAAPAPAPVVAAPAPAPAPARAPAPVSKGPDRASAIRAAMGMMAGAGNDAGGPASVFSASKLVAIDVDEFAHDPELEEAAIRFANGDDAGAEAGLMEVLGPTGPRIDHDETWLTLFDLYRATGQQERFESTAIEFAGRFGRSAPQWVSLPEAVGRMGTGNAVGADAGLHGPPDWVAPVMLGAQSVPALAATLSKAAQPWKLSWGKLAGIEPAALEPLARLFGQWAGQPLQLRFVDADNLERILKDETISGDKSVNPNWWKLRMEVLRVMHRPDEFELVALDYCVTYEVSPPSWDSARCEYKALNADGTSVPPGHTIIGDPTHDSIATAAATDVPAGSSSLGTAHIASVELAGHILGDASDAIDMLDGKLHGADVMVISCARLIRIDFTAAGSLLNWVTARAGEGRQVQFVEVNRLIAAFFNVIGISEQSRVIPRKD